MQLTITNKIKVALASDRRLYFVSVDQPQHLLPIDEDTVRMVRQSGGTSLLFSELHDRLKDLQSRVDNGECDSRYLREVQEVFVKHLTNGRNTSQIDKFNRRARKTKEKQKS